jgi:hypothetical protein
MAGIMSTVLTFSTQLSLLVYSVISRNCRSTIPFAEDSTALTVLQIYDASRSIRAHYVLLLS